MSDLPKETHAGVLKLGDIEFTCSVLADGTRVLSETKFMEGMGMYRSGALSTRRKEDGDSAHVPLYLAYKNLKPFVEKHLGDVHSAPLMYRTKGGSKAHGIRAEVIPKICEVWLDARTAGVLKGTQLVIAAKAEMLMRALAHIGIVALVDEVTGYQEERDSDALQKLLAVYLSEERLKWARRFPQEFYRQIYRLWGWSWPTNGSRRTPEVGKLTNKLVYQKLPPGVLEELRKRNPKVPGKHWRAAKHHQHLSEDLGQPDLHAHLLQLIAVMRVSPNKATFLRNVARAFPGPDGQQERIEGIPEDDEEGAPPAAV